MSFVARLLFLSASAALAGCAGAPAAVSPAEIPELEERLAREPENGSLVLRYSAALFSAGRCDSAMAVARTGMRLAPAEAVGALVLGQCLERAGDAAQAVATYRAFMNAYPDARGVAAVRAREMLAFRAQATETARAALQREAQLSAETADLQTVAVLPIQIIGDSTYLPLSRGLAQILISDLALLQRFRMVERLQLGALLDEMRFQQGARVDPATAARVGRLMQAGRLVQGVAAIPDEDDVRLDATVVLATGEVTAPASVQGRFRDLMRMEKDLVVIIASNLGYTLSEAELRLVLENGTQNLAAFLAYSSGLVAEDLGDYQVAASHYAEAVRRDPGFQAARSEHQTASATETVQQASASDVTTVADFEAPTDEFIDPLAGAVEATLTDLAPTLTEQNAQTQTGQGGTGNTNSGSDNTQPPPPPPIGIIRIVFRLP